MHNRNNLQNSDLIHSRVIGRDSVGYSNAYRGSSKAQEASSKFLAKIIRVYFATKRDIFTPLVMLSCIINLPFENIPAESI